MPIFRLIILFEVTTRIGLKYSVFNPVSLRPLLLNTHCPLIGQLTHAWASTASNNTAVVLNQILLAKSAVCLKLRKYVTRWSRVMSQSHVIKGRTTDEALKGLCFLWGERSEEREASVGADLFNFKDIWHAITLWNPEGKESTQKAEKASFKINDSCGTKNYLMC